jgi:hypothetical protein
MNCQPSPEVLDVAPEVLEVAPEVLEVAPEVLEAAPEVLDAAPGSSESMGKPTVCLDESWVRTQPRTVPTMRMVQK